MEQWYEDEAAVQRAKNAVVNDDNVRKLAEELEDQITAAQEAEELKHHKARYSEQEEEEKLAQIQDRIEHSDNMRAAVQYMKDVRDNPHGYNMGNIEEGKDIVRDIEMEEMRAEIDNVVRKANMPLQANEPTSEDIFDVFANAFGVDKDWELEKPIPKMIAVDPDDEPDKIVGFSLPKDEPSLQTTWASGPVLYKTMPNSPSIEPVAINQQPASIFVPAFTIEPPTNELVWDYGPDTHDARPDDVKLAQRVATLEQSILGQHKAVSDYTKLVERIVQTLASASELATLQEGLLRELEKKVGNLEIHTANYGALYENNREDLAFLLDNISQGGQTLREKSAASRGMCKAMGPGSYDTHGAKEKAQLKELEDMKAYRDARRTLIKDTVEKLEDKRVSKDTKLKALGINVHPHEQWMLDNLKAKHAKLCAIRPHLMTHEDIDEIERLEREMENLGYTTAKVIKEEGGKIEPPRPYSYLGNKMSFKEFVDFEWNEIKLTLAEKLSGFGSKLVKLLKWLYK